MNIIINEKKKRVLLISLIVILCGFGFYEGISKLRANIWGSIYFLFSIIFIWIAVCLARTSIDYKVFNEHGIFYVKRNEVIRYVLWSEFKYAYIYSQSKGLAVVTLSPIQLSQKKIKWMSGRECKEKHLEICYLNWTNSKERDVLQYIKQRYNVENVRHIF